MDGANLYVVANGDVVSPKAPVSPRSSKSDPLRRLPSRLGADEEGSDDTTTRVADPVAAAQATATGDPMIPIDEEDEDEIPTRNYEPDAFDAGSDGFTPPPPRQPGKPLRPARVRLPTPPPPPAVRMDNAFMPPPPLPPESPFDEFPPTPGPDPSFSSEEPEFASETPPPMRPSGAFTALPPPQPFGGLPPPPALNFGGGPPPGRPGLPRPGGYLDPSYGSNLHLPPAPPAATVDQNGFAQGGGFGGGFPETVDFGRNSSPVVIRRSGPPGLVVLLTLIAGAAGGAWLGEKVTHNAVAALDASTAAAPAKVAAPRKPAAPEISPTSPQKK
jgi:hypothetical protein